jgi:hypothetical protein
MPNAPAELRPTGENAKNHQKTGAVGRQLQWVVRLGTPLASSSDHLIRPEEEPWGKRQAKGFGSLEIEHQLDAHALLYR